MSIDMSLERKIFIGSSNGTRDIAHAIKDKIYEYAKEKSDVNLSANVRTEPGVFKAGVTTRVNLVNALKEHDAAILLYSKETRNRIRNPRVPNINVVFEHGMAHGFYIQKNILCIKLNDDCVIPSDTDGITYLEYNSSQFDDDFKIWLANVSATRKGVFSYERSAMAFCEVFQDLSVSYDTLRCFGMTSSVGCRSFTGIGKPGHEAKVKEAHMLLFDDPADDKRESVQDAICQWKNLQDKSRIQSELTVKGHNLQTNSEYYIFDDKVLLLCDPSTNSDDDGFVFVSNKSSCDAKEWIKAKIKAFDEMFIKSSTHTLYTKKTEVK
jgi:hypothetical protein